MSKKKVVTSAKEYRTGKRKVIDLPSGAKFEIRKMSPLVFGELMSIMNIEEGTSSEETERIFRERFIDVMKIIIPHCIVSPRIVFEQGADIDEDALDLNDLELNDIFALFDSIYEFSGLSPEEVAQRESFRKKPTRKSRRKASSDK